MTLLSATVVVVPGLPVAIFNPVLAVAIAATDAAVGFVLLQLGLLRFGALGRRLDLLAGVAFGTLALGNLVVRVVWVLLGGLRLELTLMMLLLSQLLAALLFAAGLVWGPREVHPDVRRAVALRVLGGCGVVLVGSSLGVLYLTDRISSAVDAEARAVVAARAPVTDFLTGQSGWLLLLNGALAVMFLLVALGYMRASWRFADPQTAIVAAGLLLLTFAQLHAALFPPLDTGYVGSSDAIRLSAYLTVLFALARRLAAEIAARATHEERLRLSRELHDGLAQSLSLLQLRLRRASMPGRPAEARARDLDAAQRLVEASLLDARQAIAVLRTGRISWQDLISAVVSFADEFALNHEVEVQVRPEGELPTLDTELQLEILRVLHEAFSNALRHGRATSLRVGLVGTSAGLNVTIHDNGRGFNVERVLVSRGVGLDSIIERLQRRRGRFHIESQPGQGATIHVWLPVTSYGMRQATRETAGRLEGQPA